MSTGFNSRNPRSMLGGLFGGSSPAGNAPPINALLNNIPGLSGGKRPASARSQGPRDIGFGGKSRQDPLSGLGIGTRGAGSRNPFASKGLEGGFSRTFMGEGGTPTSLKSIFDSIAPPTASGAAPEYGQGAGGFSDSSQFSGTYQWDDILQRVASESGVPVDVLRSIMAIESGGTNVGANDAGATGLMQVVPEYWQQTANKYGGDLMDPYTNIRTAADILQMGYDSYGQDWNNAAAFYFGGGGAFADGGGYSNAADYFGTDISTYVERFEENRTALEQGGQWSEIAGATGNAIDVARQFIGMPYEWGGASPDTSFDCSGLTQYSYAQSGIQLPRTAQQQYEATTRIDAGQAQAGDLVFFHSTAPSGEYITHVGIYLGDGKMLHAGSQGIVTADLNTSYWQQHMAGFGRAG